MLAIQQPVQQPQRLGPPRWTSQIVIATEATTAMLRTMALVVIEVLYPECPEKPSGHQSGCGTRALR